MVGKQIGQYRVVERLGNGGMGAVYRGIDTLLDRPVALKILETEADSSTARFRTEAAALARLSHPGIATLYELLEDDGRLVMVMELVKGQTLHQIVEQVGMLTPKRAAELCMQVLEALSHAHAAGVVHRDLKPGNLMLTESGTIKILDFGIARLEGAAHLTKAGMMMGTPAYMAPEQVLGTVIDARADLYAMGVVFYRLITAELPFRGDTPFEMAQSQVKDDPTPVKLIRPELPSWAGEIIGHALAKSPDQRFQSAMEFHEELARSLGNRPHVVETRAGEATEILERPDAEPAAASPVTVASKKQDSTSWLGLAGAALVVGVVAWMLIPAAGSSSEAAAVEQQAPTESPLSTPISESAATQPSAGLAQPARPAQPAATPSSVANEKSEPTAEEVPLVQFKNVKWLAVNGARTEARDAVLALSSAELSAAAPAGSDSFGALTYRSIAKVTYVNARDPSWDAALAAPAGKINVPGILGRSRHWLVVQTTETYAILRLDGDDRMEVLKTLEARTGLTIDRPTKEVK